MFDYPNAIYSGIYKLGKKKGEYVEQKKRKRNSEKFDLTYSDTLRELGSYVFNREVYE